MTEHSNCIIKTIDSMTDMKDLSMTDHTFRIYNAKKLNIREGADDIHSNIWKKTSLKFYIYLRKHTG